LFKDVLEVLDYIGSILDGGKQTDVVYMDMSKVFDKVNHKSLIQKLRNSFGMVASFIGWTHICHKENVLLF
jgi:hypothetical protein